MAEEGDRAAGKCSTSGFGVPGGLQILWIKTELLHPVDKGGKIRTIEMLKQLKRFHHITYLTLDDGTAPADARTRAEEYCHELICIPFRMAPRWSARFYGELLQNLLSKLPYAIGRYRSEAMRRAITEKAQADRYDVVICDFLVSAVNVPDHLPIPKVLFQHNVEAMIWQRHAKNQRYAAARMFFALQWRRMIAFERRSCQAFDAVIGVSEDDCDVMRREYGVRTIAAVPTGVDTEYFRPRGVRARMPCSLVFTGSMDWLPNEDAISFFMKEIMPTVLRQVPDSTLTVVGRNPSAALLDLARNHPALAVTGRVDDVRPFLEQAACFVVPIRIGGGTRLKIFEAMAMEKPVVSTSIGAEGLPIREGVDVMLADDPGDFAACIVRLIRDEDLARKIGAQAASTVRSQFGWAHVAERFSELCQSAIRSHSA